MTKKTIYLHFPPERVRDPVIYRLVKDFDLVVNILQAKIEPNEQGHALVELTGNRSDIQRGIQYIQEQGVAIDTAGQEIRLNAERCTNCGACVGVCPSGALCFNDDFTVSLDTEKCVLCQGCILACPFEALEHTA
jgi:ferredoxin